MYDVGDPDVTIPLWSRVIIGVGSKNGHPYRSEHIAFKHVVRLEHLDTDASQVAVGANSDAG